MTLPAAFTSHRRAREVWSQRLAVTAFLAVGRALRFTGVEHRAMLEPDPYGDAYSSTTPRAHRAVVIELPGQLPSTSR